MESQLEPHLSPTQAEEHAKAVAADLIETMGLIAVEEHLPRIAGRIWGLLVTEDAALSLDEIADRLQVSRASVSTNSHRLEDLHLIERTAKPADRRDYWRVPDVPHSDFLARIRERFDKREKLFRRAQKALEEVRPGASKRLGIRADIAQEVIHSLSEALLRPEYQGGDT